MRNAFCVALAIALGGCGMTTPVAVVNSNGEVLSGSASSGLTNGTFAVRNAAVACSGSFDPSGDISVSVVVKCSDGRSGIGRAIRDTAMSGSGTINMSDGTKAAFAFGNAAATLQLR